MSERAGPHPFRAWSLTWVTYAAYYTGRKGFSVSKKTIATEQGVTEAELGLIDTAFLGAYAAALFANGVLADRIGARRLLGIGLFGTAAACAAFGSSSTALAFGAWMFVNGLFQATGWPGTTRAMAAWTTPENRGTVMAYWATCYQVGGIVANWLCGMLLVRWGFRAAFFGPALLLASLAAVVWLLLPKDAVEQRDGRAETAPARAASLHVTAASVATTAQPSVWKSGLLWSYGASYFFIKFIRYALLMWLPYYLATTLGHAADTAANLASAFEAGGIVGVIVLGTLSDRLVFFSRAAVSAVSLVLLGGALFLYTRIATEGLLMNALGLALVGALLFGPDSLLSGAAAQDAGGQRSAGTATGLVNGLGSIGGLTEGLVVPRLSRAFGWDALFPTLVALALAAALALIPALRRGASVRARTAESTPPR